AVLEDVARSRLPLPGRGVEIALLDWGGVGPLALFHHANGFCAAMLDLVARPLRAHFRVIGMGARGHGDSSRPTGANAYARQECGAALAAGARALSARHGKIALGLGHSFGGTSMLLAAAEEPALFERLVLVDPVLHEPRAVQSYDPERSARAFGLVERASRRRVVFPDRAAARENWGDKERFAEWGPRAVGVAVAGAMAGRGREEGGAGRRAGRAQVRARDRVGRVRERLHLRHLEPDREARGADADPLGPARQFPARRLRGLRRAAARCADPGRRRGPSDPDGEAR